MTHGHHPPDADAWDERYSERAGDGAMWSGRPNGTLVAELDDEAPGSVLDVGCGEGADAIWLAKRGWSVTALDPSGVALERAKLAAAAAGVEITWIHGGVLDAPNGLGRHDLVTAQYPAIPKSDAAITALIDAVDEGGTLLFVHHLVEPGHHHGHHDPDDEGPGFDPADYVMPVDVRAALDDGWIIEVDEIRDRPDGPSEVSHHDRDIILRARLAARRSAS